MQFNNKVSWLLLSCSLPSSHLLLRTIRSLFSDDADPLVPQDPNGENGDPAAVDELHRLDGQHGGDDVVGVVLTTGHRHEAVARAADEDEAALIF